MKKRRIYKEADPKKRKKFTEFVKKQDKNRLVFVDESGIDRHLHREYCRAPKGKQVYEAVPGWKFDRCSIVAGKCGKEVLAPFGYYGTCNSELFLKWVKEMLVPNLKKNQIVIMDNASIHKSPKIREAIEKAGCSLVYQPPYSPDLNSIEHFWSYLKKKIWALKQKFESNFDAIQYVLAN
ncbi:MAG: IS630 family transposase [Alphaproteobacteria bacterium]|nr:IS630 family transposase [Alphaproteobacteria bacterium]